jgi:hypothetical protein
MKKILSLLVLLVAFTSCEEDIQFNNPAVQAFKDNEQWRATDFDAVKNGNTVILTAHINDVETVVLYINAPAPESVHELGVNELNRATYQFSVDGISGDYKTGTGIGNGRITLNRAEDNNLDGTGGKAFISGSFWFNALNADGDIVNFQKGEFYKVPMTIEL